MTARTCAPAARSTTAAAAVLLAVAGLVLMFRAPAADAGIGDESGGNNDGGRYSAWAYYTAAGGPDTVSTPERCTLSSPSARDLEAYYEWYIRDLGDGSYLVAYTCTAVMFHNHTYLNNGFEVWEVTETIGDAQIVTPAPIDDLVARAIANLDPTPPEIVTNLNAGVHGLVHVPVTFQLTGDLGPQTGTAASAGPIRVVLTAWPNEGVPITWHPGDAQTPCTGGEPWGTCTHDYARSSYGQNHHGLGQDQYRVTAGMSYTGRYDVYIDGNPAPIAGAVIGDVDRTVELGLSVDEGQAVNTPH